MVATQPRHKVKSVLSSRMSSEKYLGLTDDERIVLTILDSFAPNDDALAWPCDYDQLMDVAGQSPKIESDQIITIIGRLQGFKILDSSFSLFGDKMEIWVAPYTYRNRLRNSINDELIARRAAAKVSPAA